MNKSWVWVPIINKQGFISNTTTGLCGNGCRFIRRGGNGIECAIGQSFGKTIPNITPQLDLSLEDPSTTPQNNACPARISIGNQQLSFVPHAALVREV